MGNGNGTTGVAATAPAPATVPTNIDAFSREAGEDAIASEEPSSSAWQGFVRLQSVVLDGELDWGAVGTAEKKWGFKSDLLGNYNLTIFSAFAKTAPNKLCYGDIYCKNSGPMNLGFFLGDFYLSGTAKFSPISSDTASTFSYKFGLYTFLANELPNEAGIKWAILTDKYQMPGMESDAGVMLNWHQYISDYVALEIWGTGNVMRDMNTNALEVGGDIENIGPMASGNAGLIVHTDGGHTFVASASVMHTWLNEDNGGKEVWEGGGYLGANISLGKGITMSPQAYYYRTMSDVDKFLVYTDLNIPISADKGMLTAYLFMVSNVSEPKEVGSSDVTHKGSRQAELMDERVAGGVKVIVPGTGGILSVAVEAGRTSSGPQQEDRPAIAPVNSNSGLPDSFYGMAQLQANY